MDDPLGKLQWGTLQIVQAARLLHSPRYAGAFCYGRTRTRRNVEGGPTLQRLPREHWHTLIVGAHAGYISWEEYEHNQRKLLENAQAYGADRRGPPREGPALLQGLAICGVCGYRMTVHYHRSGARLIPEYLCQKSTAIHTPQRSCGAISGAELDRAIGELLVEGVTPLTLEVALAVQQELEQRAEEADRLRRTQVERARYEAELARRRFMRVDPDNRLVADSLESEWNEKLRLHDEELYGVGSGNRIYVINAVTVIATQAGSGSAFNPGSIGTNLGVDFNPTVDRIRVVSDTGQNLRLNQITGTVVDFDPNTNGIQTDNLLAYAQGDASFGQNPRVVGAAYTNNFTGGISTTLYGIDSSLDTLVRQGGPGGNPSPNLGALTTVGPLGVDVSEVTGFDIVGFDSAGFAAFTVAGETVSRLYRVDLNTGTTALVGTLGGSESIRDIAVIHYDVQLQDDISSTILRFSSTTGEYEYTDCAGPSRLTGTGGVTVNSTRVTFLDRGMGGQSLDRLLVAFVDPANARGLALVHSFITRTTRIINDSDLVNNSGLCP
jgi:hypothetical protein